MTMATVAFGCSTTAVAPGSAADVERTLSRAEGAACWCLTTPGAEHLVQGRSFAVAVEVNTQGDVSQAKVTEDNGMLPAERRCLEQSYRELHFSPPKAPLSLRRVVTLGLWLRPGTEASTATPEPDETRLWCTPPPRQPPVDEDVIVQRRQ